MYNVYLDDQRNEPSGWYRTKTADETILILEAHQGEINTLSLDHDLGACPDCIEKHGGSAEAWLVGSQFTEMPHCEHVGTGYSVACWLEEQVYTNLAFIFPKHIECHSANPVGRNNIEQVIKKLKEMGKIT